jgi:ankyrin repeat protein
MHRPPLIFCLLPLLWAFGCSERSAPDTADEPPLIQAAEQGDLSRLNRLLQQAPEADIRDQCQWTPLMKAALHGHLEAARQLLAAGADANAVDKGGYSALMLAASNNHEALIHLLAEHRAELDHAEPGLGWTALIWAAKLGHSQAVQALLQRGADPTLQDLAGNSAVDWARNNDHQQALMLLQP